MAAYATTTDVQDRMLRTMSTDEISVCSKLLDDAAVMIDTRAPNAGADAKKVVSCRMVIRALGDGGASSAVPMGATQGTMLALGYQQSWTFGANGAAGELYLGQKDLRDLGCGYRIGSYSPVQELAGGDDP